MHRVILSLAVAVAVTGCGQRGPAPKGEDQGSARNVFTPPDHAPVAFSITTLVGLLGSPLGQGPLLAASTLVPETPDPADHAGRRRPRVTQEMPGRRRPTQAAVDFHLPGRAGGAHQADAAHLQGRARTAPPTPRRRFIPRPRPPMPPPH
jgi:hypothetical protein